MDDDDHDHDHDHDHEASDEPAANDGDSDDSSQQRARPETMGGDPVEEVRRKRKTLSRRYKIQEVVARRQIMLVQVVKEERGNKGAALTTYLSRSEERRVGTESVSTCRSRWSR